MTPQFSLHASQRFARLARRLTGQHPNEFPGQYAEAIDILGSDPTNRTRRFRIKKLVDVPAGEGQWRLALGRVRFRYDIAGSTLSSSSAASAARTRTVSQVN
jgi:hypothetical protein